MDFCVRTMLHHCKNKTRLPIWWHLERKKALTKVINSMCKTIFFIAIGGAIGSVFRYLTSVFVAKYWSHNFPLSTLIINTLGCLLIGIITGYCIKNNLQNAAVSWFFITGFCGGFTTFSAFGLENVQLFQNNQFFVAFGYMGLSFLLGIAAVWVGLQLVR